MSDGLVMLTAAEHRALVELAEWARNSKGAGVTNTPRGLVVSRGARNTRRGAAAGLRTAWCYVVSIAADHLICRPFEMADYTDASQDFAVAKPPELQETRFATPRPNQDGDILSYTFVTADQARTVTDTGDSSSEDQVIVPAYVPTQTISGTLYLGSLILAVSGITGGTGVTYTNAANYTVPVVWQDLNLAGRAWAEDNGS